MLPLTYLLPLRAAEPRTDLAPYLARLVADVDEVLVVDGSAADVAAAHSEAWPREVRLMPVDPGRRCANGKVAGVLTGLAAARHDVVVIADDDVRWSGGLLSQAAQRIGGVDLVIPQNAYTALPWWAAEDTARSLLNRALAYDWPGTLVVRRDVLLAAGGYDGDVLFENLELVRTVRAAGGRVLVARDLVVPREPPTRSHFGGQRVRQAYDSLAQPARLAAELALLPAAALVARRWGWRGVATAAGAAIATAEAGRRRDGGGTAFPAHASLWAPAWLAERAACSWGALWCRVALGGASYAGGRLRIAATPQRVLDRRLADQRDAADAARAGQSNPRAASAGGRHPAIAS